MQPDETLEFPYEDILVPTDGSTAATHAAEHTLSLGASLGATVHVLSVIDDTALGLDVRSTISGTAGEQAATDAIETVLTEAETRGVRNTVHHVAHGAPVEKILEYIDANDVHAVGMGTTGSRSTDRILLGSVAEKTVRSAPVPVLTVADAE